jgi:hypothetical protein
MILDLTADTLGSSRWAAAYFESMTLKFFDQYHILTSDYFRVNINPSGGQERHTNMLLTWLRFGL